MSDGNSVFHFDPSKKSFEDLGKPNGITHWTEEVVKDCFGYRTDSGFEKALIRAKQTCLTLGLATEDHFKRQADGSHLITRFGCYLLAMNGDTKKPEVAAAQVYFAAIAETFKTHLEHADGIDRLLVRDEISDGQKSLHSTAKRHGVENYAYFQNKGYLGMYNMSLGRLKELKGVKDGEEFIDRMSKEEMAAHLFRITQTDAKINRENIQGQSRLEQAAHDVGRKVRATMRDLSGLSPEHIPLVENIKDVKKKLKSSDRNMKKLDGKKKPKGIAEN